MAYILGISIIVITLLIMSICQESNISRQIYFTTSMGFVMTLVAVLSQHIII